MTKTKSEETPRCYTHPSKLVLRKDPANGTPMLAPQGRSFADVHDASYASSPSASSDSTRELTRQDSDSTVEENLGNLASEVDVAANEAMNEEDSDKWIATNVLETTAKLKSDKQFYNTTRSLSRLQ